MREKHVPRVGDEPPFGRLAYYCTLREYPSVADEKATALVAANGLMISVLVLFARPVGTLLAQSGWSPALVLLMLAPLGVLLLAGVTDALRVLVMPLPAIPRCLAAFPEVAGLPLARYSEEMRRMDHPQALREILHYNHTVAVLSARKFRLVDRGFACLRIAFGLWLAILLLIAVVR